MQHSTERIRTTHTGSLPRSEELTRAMYIHQEEKGSDEDLWKLVSEEVTAIVAEQVRVGIDVVSDGEVGKPGFTNYVRTRFGGLGGQTEMWYFNDLVEVPELMNDQFGSEAGAHINMPACVEPLSYMGHGELRRDLLNLEQAVAQSGAEEAFVPAASPGILAIQITDRHYGSYEEFIHAIAGALREEYKAIVDAGFILQVDAPDLPVLGPGHTKFWGSQQLERYSYQQVLELHLDAIRTATEGLPANRVRLHLCWGNYEAPHHYDVPLQDVMGTVLRKSPAQAISFEAANPRHEHEWEVFRDLAVPDDIILIPGVIDTLTNFVEHPRLVSQRIERFAAAVGRERVIASTDCGFGTFVGFGEVVPKVAWMKLRGLAEGATLASETLWPSTPASASQ